MKLRTKIAAAAGLTAALVSPAAVAGAQEEASTSTVTVIHGIPGKDLGLDDNALAVDVKVDDSCVLTDFTFGDVSPRLELPEGMYDIAVSLSDGACGGDVAIEADDVAVPGGVNATAVAHLDDEGAPTLGVFVNDLSPAGLYRTRVAVHHLANAPTVDIDVTKSQPMLWSHPFISVEGISNGEQAVADTWVGTYNVDIFPAGGDEAVFSVEDLSLIARYYGVYAVGSLENGTFTLITDMQPFEGGSEH